MALVAGTRLGPYKIAEQLGAGGMGEVYRGTDTRLDRTVAIKVLPEHLAERVDLHQRFQREARAVSSLNHPHICMLYDVGEQDGIHYLVMEYVEGKTLAERLKDGKLPIKELLQYSIQIADALDKAHRKGVVHRDLKPANIMLTRSGVKLLDFGLAKLKADSVLTRTSPSEFPTDSQLTNAGTVVGTLQYMSPEQLEGRDADARSDIFSLGLVMYEATAGRKAFEGKSPGEPHRRAAASRPASGIGTLGRYARIRAHRPQVSQQGPRGPLADRTGSVRRAELGLPWTAVRAQT